MGQKLLLGTAVVLASVGLASAQNAQNTGSNKEPSGAAQQSERSQSGTGGAEQTQNQTQGGTRRGDRQTSGQRDSSTPGRDQAEQRSNQNRNSGTSDNREPNREEPAREPNQRTGQENRNQNQRTGQQGEQNQRTGQEAGGGERNQGQGEQRQGAGQQRTGEATSTGEREGSINLSSEQRTRLREAVSSGRDVPRVDNVNFRLDVGTRIPDDVRLAAVPQTLIEAHPDWRDYSYFVVRDEVVVVDHNHSVIATVPFGSSGGSREARGSATNNINLDQAQIRELQMELRRQGFEVGEVDGVIGPRTKEALIAFQKQHGFRASGEFDRETFAALSGNGQQGGAQTSPRAGEEKGTSGQAGSERRGSNDPDRGQTNAQTSSPGQNPNSQQRNSSSGAQPFPTTGQGSESQSTRNQSSPGEQRNSSGSAGEQRSDQPRPYQQR